MAGLVTVACTKETTVASQFISTGHQNLMTVARDELSVAAVFVCIEFCTLHGLTATDLWMSVGQLRGVMPDADKSLIFCGRP